MRFAGQGSDFDDLKEAADARGYPGTYELDFSDYESLWDFLVDGVNDTEFGLTWNSHTGPTAQVARLERTASALVCSCEASAGSDVFSWIDIAIANVQSMRMAPNLVMEIDATFSVVDNTSGTGARFYFDDDDGNPVAEDASILYVGSDGANRVLEHQTRRDGTFTTAQKATIPSYTDRRWYVLQRCGTEQTSLSQIVGGAVDTEPTDIADDAPAYSEDKPIRGRIRFDVKASTKLVVKIWRIRYSGLPRE